MNGIRAAFLILVAMALTSCTSESPELGGGTSPTLSGSLTSVAASPQSGVPLVGAPVQYVGDPATLTIDGTEVWLGVDTDGCVTLLALIDSEYYTPMQRCEGRSGYWLDTVECAFRPDVESTGGAAASRGLAPCEVIMPRISAGHELNSPDLLCLAAEAESGFGPVRFVEPTSENLWLAAVPPGALGVFAIAYTADGRRYGEPPLDDAGAVYALCEAAAPWTGSPPAEAEMDVVLRFRDDLHEDVGGLYFDFGKGPEWVEFRSGKTVVIRTTTFVDTTEVGITLFGKDLARQTAVATYPYPEALVAELTSGWQCWDAPTLVIDVGREILDVDPAAITLSALSPAEMEEIGMYGGPVTGRQPGEPCPNNGSRRTVPERPSSPERLIRATIVLEIDPSWLALGSEWALAVLHEVSPDGFSGMICDFGFLAENPDERIGPDGLFAVGHRVRVGIVPGSGEFDDDDPGLITLEVPPVPDELASGMASGIQLELVVGPGDTSGPRLDASTLRLAWRSSE